VQNRQNTHPGTGLGGGMTSGVRFGLAHSSDGLYAIWPILFLILPQDFLVVLLVFFATLGVG
jgi:hypothetical protein